MIGQKCVLNLLDRMKQNGFPRFVILHGEEGSGKTKLAIEISKMLNMPIVPCGNSVEEVREVITNAYNNTENVIYLLTDTDKMSIAAKNALLKVTEEPPQKAYFIQTVTTTANTLNTLLSRACVITMQPYTTMELIKYMNLKYDNESLDPQDSKFITDVTSVPGQVDTLMSYDVTEFRQFVEMVADNLHTVSSANAFKIENKLALKKDEDKWDVVLFLQALRNNYFRKFLQTGDIPYFQAYEIACDTIKQIKTKNSVNKQYCMDEFILAVRKCWREHELSGT